MYDIKLFVCCHQNTFVPEHPLLVPLQVGAALSEERFSGFFHDDVGENISEKNGSYCELTAQYWAWKNVEADYYGFFHYRRYLYPDQKEKSPYRIKKMPSLLLLDELGFERFGDMISHYDMIVPIGEDMHISVQKYYAKALYHHQCDLELIKEIVLERHPEMTGVMEAYLSGTVCYFGNIYIMRQEIFQNYCSWLFPILEEFDRRADTADYSAQEKRVDGYLAERLFGCYYRDCREKLRTIELPRAYFCSGKEYVRKRLLNGLLPPGSRQRSFVKNFLSL